MTALRESRARRRTVATRDRAEPSDVVRYYEVAGPDYAAWSPSYNMHFGLWEPWANPFRREPMLERTNQATLDHLEVPRDASATIVDMGCGLGATARYVAERRPRARVHGFTIVPWQVETGNALSATRGVSGRVRLELADYASTPMPDACADAAYAIESASYAKGAAKEDLVAEMARVVKPGGRVSFSDGFRKDARPLRGFLGFAYRVVCRSWAIREMAVIGPFVRALETRGFEDVRVEERSWSMAPSFLHVPFLCASFALKRVLRGDVQWSRERWQNLLGPLFGCVIGLARSRFGYYLIRATRASGSHRDAIRGRSGPVSRCERFRRGASDPSLGRFILPSARRGGPSSRASP